MQTTLEEDTRTQLLLKYKVVFKDQVNYALYAPYLVERLRENNIDLHSRLIKTIKNVILDDNEREEAKLYALMFLNQVLTIQNNQIQIKTIFLQEGLLGDLENFFISRLNTSEVSNIDKFLLESFLSWAQNFRENSEFQEVVNNLHTNFNVEISEQQPQFVQQSLRAVSTCEKKIIECEQLLLLLLEVLYRADAQSQLDNIKVAVSGLGSLANSLDSNFDFGSEMHVSERNDLKSKIIKLELLSEDIADQFKAVSTQPILFGNFQNNLIAILFDYFSLQAMPQDYAFERQDNASLRQSELKKEEAAVVHQRKIHNDLERMSSRESEGRVSANNLDDDYENVQFVNDVLPTTTAVQKEQANADDEQNCQSKYHLHLAEQQSDSVGNNTSASKAEKQLYSPLQILRQEREIVPQESPQLRLSIRQSNSNQQDELSNEHKFANGVPLYLKAAVSNQQEEEQQQNEFVLQHQHYQPEQDFAIRSPLNSHYQQQAKNSFQGQIIYQREYHQGEIRDNQPQQWHRQSRDLRTGITTFTSTVTTPSQNPPSQFSVPTAHFVRNSQIFEPMTQSVIVRRPSIVPVQQMRASIICDVPVLQTSQGLRKSIVLVNNRGIIQQQQISVLPQQHLIKRVQQQQLSTLNKPQTARKKFVFAGSNAPPRPVFTQRPSIQQHSSTNPSNYYTLPQQALFTTQIKTTQPQQYQPYVRGGSFTLPLPLPQQASARINFTRG